MLRHFLLLGFSLLFSLTAAAPAAAALSPLQQVEEDEWIDQLEAAQDGYAVSQAARELADVRTTSAMQARIRLYDEKMDIRGGVHLRDWLYTGMMRAQSAEELGLLAEAAASRKNSELLRLVCLRAIRRSSAPIDAEVLLDRAFRKLEGENARAWQAAAGAVLAQQRLTAESTAKARQELREALLDRGMPFLGFRTLIPSDEELAVIAEQYDLSSSAADRAQVLHVLAPHAAHSPLVLSQYLRMTQGAVTRGERAERVAAWVAATEHRVFECAPILIRGLEIAESNPPSRHTRDLANALRDLTGKQFGNTSESWQRWWERDGQAWLTDARKQAGSTPKGSAPAEEDETVSTYFGIPVDSDRIGFVLDGSGSMNDELEDGRRCADAAAEELVRFLERFPDDGVLNLRVIVRGAESPFKEPVVASKKNRTRAIRFIERFDFGPASAMYDVLMEAQQDEDIDTLLFVSDGGGSWGSFAYSGHMLDGLRLAYERSGVRIHCICVGKDRNKARFMEQLAELTSGRIERI